MMDIVRKIMEAEAIKQAAEAVVKEWEDGIIVTKDGYGAGGLTIACLRDALSGHIPDEVRDLATLDDNIPIDMPCS